MAIDNPYKFSLQTIQIKNIIPNPKNPRGIKKNRVRGLKNQMRKFGYLDRIILNADLTILAGHQRFEILKADGAEEIECFVPEKQIPENEADELLIGHNLNTGFWNEVLLDEHFDEEFLNAMEFGRELDKVKRDFGKNDDPIYPIAPRFSEKHNFVMIITDNEIDEANLRSTLGLGKMKDYKTSAVSEGYIMTFDEFKAAIK